MKSAPPALVVRRFRDGEVVDVPGGSPLLELRASVPPMAEKLEAREVSAAIARLRADAERRLGARRVAQGVGYVLDWVDGARGTSLTLRVFSAG